jgi:hypothetical protein
MHIIKNRHNSCLLACFESFLLDHNVSVTQEQMIQRLSPQDCDANGTVYWERMLPAAERCGIHFTEISKHFPVDSKHTDGSLMFLTDFLEAGQMVWHAMRFIKHVKGDETEVMDPDWRREEPNVFETAAIQKWRLEQMNCHYYQAKLRT